MSKSVTITDEELKRDFISDGLTEEEVEQMLIRLGWKKKNQKS